MVADTMKLYITNLHFGGTQKRLYFEGPAGPTGEEAFQNAKRQLASFAHGTDDWPTFFQQAIKTFESHGFQRIAK